MEKCGQMIISNQKLAERKVEELINKGFTVRVSIDSKGKKIIDIYREKLNKTNIL